MVALGALRGRVGARLDARDRYPRAVLLTGLAGLFATTFPVTILTLALPTIAEDFGVDEAGLAWLITLPMLGSALALPVLGKLGDLHGHRRVFIGGFALAVVATALSATAPNPAALIAWRTFSQVAGSSTMPSSLALINAVHHGKARAKAMGWWSMIAAVGPVIGLIIGAPAIDAVGWPMLFVLQAGVMTVPLAASWTVLRETPSVKARFDVPGAAALALGIGPLLLAVDQAPDWGFASPLTVACLVVAVVALVAFSTIERRAVAPLVPLDLVRTAAPRAALAASLMTGAAYMGGFFLASLMLVEQFGYSLTSAVPILVIRPAIFAASSPLGGRVTARAGVRVAAVAGGLSLAAGLTGLAVGSALDSLAVVVGAGLVLQGIGYGLLRPALTTALADSVAEHDLGMAGASERLANQLGIVFGITTMASVYASDVAHLPPAFLVGTGFAAAGTVVALRMHPRHRHPAPEEEVEPAPAEAVLPPTPPAPGARVGRGGPPP
ncbi:MFS transporter [Iamia majanohamensis]|uniref:MFS transporter n=1 Tax=Iamia majanohamensis TaxID=467976 RepID=A0AAF0BRC5_9ACTN|nr:MFS transporter [Iamia majanohamensis]WCO66396.1 MFS transporter [Iamia majanohamensis]